MHISIHAPRGGSDPDRERGAAGRDDFNPRPPRRERQQTQPIACLSSLLYYSIFYRILQASDTYKPHIAAKKIKKQARTSRRFRVRSGFAPNKIERMIEMSNSTKSLEKAQQIVSLLEGFSRSEWRALRDSIERAFDAQANSIKFAPGERLSRMLETEFTP